MLTSGYRDLRIDFFRGLALIFIFWDHIPGNLFGQITLRNIGFSDAAELFVFLAGYAAAVAYGRQYLQSGYFVAAMQILRRAWVLYVAHIFLLAQLMALIFVANGYVETRDFIAEMGLGYFVENPERALVDSMLLRFRPNLTDPLPLYIVLLLLLTVALPLLMRRPGLLLCASASIYIGATRMGWNFSALPQGAWYFNPLAWQLLFFIGAVVGMYRGHISAVFGAVAAPLRRRLLALTLIWLAISALVALSWNWPQWHDRWMPAALGEWLYPIDKTNLAGIRLIHFAALAFAVSVTLPSGAWLQTPFTEAIRLLGRHSLQVFCLGVLLAPLADAIDTLANDGLLIQFVTSFVGTLLLWYLARLLDWFRQGGRAAKAPQRGVDTAEADRITPS